MYTLIQKSFNSGNGVRTHVKSKRNNPLYREAPRRIELAPPHHARHRAQQHTIQRAIPVPFKRFKNEQHQHLLISFNSSLTLTGTSPARKGTVLYVFSSLERHFKLKEFVCLLVGCLTSQQHASVSQGRTCTDNFTCCHSEIEVADQTFYLT